LKIFLAGEEWITLKSLKEMIETVKSLVKVDIVLELSEAPHLARPRLFGVDLPRMNVEHVAAFRAEDPGHPHLEPGARPQSKVSSASQGNPPRPDPEIADWNLIN